MADRKPIVGPGQLSELDDADRVEAAGIVTTNADLVLEDATAGAVTLSSLIGGGGIGGSTGATDNAILRADGTGGSTAQSSIASIDDSGNISATNLSGTNTGDQTITLTGDVTGSGTGSFAATIANDAVTYAKIQNVSAASKLLGRGDSGSGDVEEITLGSGLTMTGTTLSAPTGGSGDVIGPASATDNAIARFDSTTGTLLQNSTMTVSDTGSVIIDCTNSHAARALEIRQTGASGATIRYFHGTANPDSVVTGNPGDIYIRGNGTSSSMYQYRGASSGTTPWEELSIGDQTITLTGDVTGTGTGSFAATIANDAVTYAKLQNVSAASKLLGRGDSGSGDAQEITLGTNLSMSGTTLNVSGAGGVIGDLSPETTVGASEGDLSRVTLDAGTYRIDCLLFWSSSSTSGGAQIGLDGSIADIIRETSVKSTSGSTSATTTISTSTSASGATSCTAAGATYWVRVVGQFRVTADASYVGFTWVRGGSAGTITNLGCTATFTLCS